MQAGSNSTNVDIDGARGKGVRLMTTIYVDKQTNLTNLLQIGLFDVDVSELFMILF